MEQVTIRRKPFIIGVMGSHTDDGPSLGDAYSLGKEAAVRGYVILTGGGPGIMKAASEGARHGGGLVIALLPSDRQRPLPGYPNECVDIPIYTGMGDARNVINAKTPHVIVALNGGPGTVSEMALALKSGVPVISLNAPCLELPGIIPVSSVRGAMKKIEEIRTGLEQHL